MKAKFEHISTFHCPVEKLFHFHETRNGFDTLINIDKSVKVIQAPESISRIGAEAIIIVKILPLLKVKWVAKHTDFKKNELFVDEQISGPFLFFKHSHKFTPLGNLSQLNDSIEFDFPFNFISKFFIVNKLKAQFKARHEATANFLEIEFKNSFSGLA